MGPTAERREDQDPGGGGGGEGGGVYHHKGCRTQDHFPMSHHCGFNLIVFAFSNDHVITVFLLCIVLLIKYIIHLNYSGTPS